MLDRKALSAHIAAFGMVVAVFMFAEIHDSIEEKDIVTTSPWLSPSEPFVIGRPLSVSDATILEMDAQINVVVAGSFWTSYSVDIVCHSWCKEYAGLATHIDDTTNVPDSAIAGVFGSLRKQSLNISLPIPTDTMENDLCAIIRPISPTRYDKGAKINVRMAYRYKKTKELARFRSVFLTWMMFGIGVIQCFIFTRQYPARTHSTGKGTPPSQNNDGNRPPNSDSSENPVIDHSKGLEQTDSRQQTSESDGGRRNTDCEYEIVPPAL